MKTILMPIHDGTITKNLLRTKFLEFLKAEEGVRVVLVPPIGKEEQYRNEFGVEGKVFVEKAVQEKGDALEHFFTGIYKHSIPTEFMRIRQVDWYWNEGKYLKYIGVSVLRMLGHIRWWRSFLRTFNSLEPIPKEVQDIYSRWQPDLVFAPTMLTRLEVCLMRLARRNGKKVVGMAKSFDNLTSKAFLRVHPDKLIVPNEVDVSWAVKLYDFPKDDVAVTGICQYDAYVDPDIIEPKTDFFREVGLDHNKNIILYAPAGDWMNPNDHVILRELLRWIDTGELPDTQVLLRLHPAYESRTEELQGDPNLVVERPGSHYGSLKTYEFGKADVSHLASSLKYADVVINTGSTMLIEAAIFETPSISLAFDGFDPLPYWRSTRRYYDREHLQPATTVKGTEVVTSFEEMKNAIIAFFDNPNLDKDGREKAVTAICYKVDGKSCERTSNVLLDLLEIKK